MSTASNIYFVGPYDEALLSHLDYPENWYINCTKDSIVSGTVYQVNGRFNSKDLADYLNVKLDDPSTWNIKGINYTSEFESWCYSMGFDHCPDLINYLVNNKYIVLFQPNC